MKGQGKGWKGESRRHSMARKGISTARGVSTRGESTDSRLKAGFGLSKQQMEDIVRDHVQDTIMFNGMDALVVDVKLWGSYLKGKEREGSDLDFIVEYKGSEREDDMFNLLNDEENKICFNGIEVDINPIKEEKSGTIEDYLKASGVFKKTLDTDDMLDFIIDNQLQDWQGEIDFNTAKEIAGQSEIWHLKEIQLDNFDWVMKPISSSEKDTPPIIIEYGDGEYEVLDGKHRIGEHNWRKEKTILAYVGRE